MAFRRRQTSWVVRGRSDALAMSEQRLLQLRGSGRLALGLRLRGALPNAARPGSRRLAAHERGQAAALVQGRVGAARSLSRVPQRACLGSRGHMTLTGVAVPSGVANCAALGAARYGSATDRR